MTIEEMKALKKEKGYSYEQIAELSGVPLGTVQKVFCGVTKYPRFSTLQALEKVFRNGEAVSYEYQRVAKENKEGETEHKPVSYQLSGEQSGNKVEERAAAYQAVKKQGEYTIDDYYALPDDRRVELIDGVIYDMSSPSFVHQGIAGEMYRQISNFLRENKGECVVRISPVDVQLDCDNRTMVQPDVLIVCDRSKIRRWGIMGAPEFLVEVLSPSTRRKDCGKKLSKYMDAGVKEYWIIDPKSKRLIVYDFEQEVWPTVYGLTGKVPIGIYQGKLEIDMDMVAEAIEEYPDGDGD